MKKVILSICIPTYNRGKILSKTLNHLILSPIKEIEILVSNDGSIDNTKDLIKLIKDSRISYFENPKNLGYDANILKCVERARGEFIFIISDEDYVDLKIISWLIEII